MTWQLEDVVTAYWRHYELSQGDRGQRLAAGEHFWAWEVVWAAVDREDVELLALLDALLEAPGSDPCYVGMGPVEDLLVAAGDRWEAAVAERCRRSAAWRQAVACAYVDQRDHLTLLRHFLPPG